MASLSNSIQEEATLDATYAMPATPFQARLWDQSRTSRHDPAWNVAVRFRLSGALDREILEGALQLLTARHEALRTALKMHKGNVVQSIAPRVTLPVEWCDLRGLSSDEQSQEVLRLSTEHACQSVPLTAAPMLRVRILRLAERENLLLWNAHHCICDGTSVGLLASDLMQCYDDLSQGRKPAATGSIEFADYAVWLEEQRRTPEYEAHRQYWVQRLRPVQDWKLPSSWRNADATAAAPVIHSTLLPRDLTERLTAVAQHNDATFFHVVLAAFAVLMRSYQSSAQVAVGTPWSGRDQTELEGVVGSFTNYLPLSFQVDIEAVCSAFLRDVRDQVTGCFDHAQFRTEDMLSDLQKDGLPIAESNLFSTVFICQKDFVRPIQVADLALMAIPSVSPGTLRPLTVFMVERADGWRLSCEVDDCIVSSALGLEIIDRYHQVLGAIAAHSETKISALLEHAGLLGEDISNSVLSDTESDFNSQKAVITVPDVVGSTEDFRRIPASEAQIRFCTLSQLNPEDASFDLRIRLELTGLLNVDALIAALKQLIRRHEILRTTFEESNGQVWQVVHPQAELDFHLDELETTSSDPLPLDGTDKKPFSLESEPLFRVRLVRFEERRHWLGITLSHAIADGWSSGVFLENLRHAYEEYSAGLRATIEPSPVQFSSYVDEESRLLAGSEKERRLAWWNEQLQGTWEPLALPRDISAPRDGASQIAASMCATALASGAVASARRFARECDGTMFSVFGAAFQALLARYSQRAEILFLTPFANRTADTEAVIGPLANPVCLTGRVTSQTTFRTLVQEFSNQSMDAMEHALPITLVAPLLEMRVMRGYHPLNQVTFFHQRAFVHDMQWGDLQVKSLPDVPTSAGTEWQLGVIERGDVISVEFLYDATLYSPQTMDIVARHYARLLTLALQEPDLPLSELQILAQQEMNEASIKNLLPVIQSLLSGQSDTRQTAKTVEDETIPSSAPASKSSSEQYLLRIWQKIFKVENLNAESNFFDLGGYSLLLAKLQISLKKEFNVQLTVADVFNQPTIGALAQWLDRARFDIQPQQARQSGIHNPRVIPIQPEGDGHPLFLISQSMIFRTMATELGRKQPVYALQMLDEDIEAMGSTTFEELIDFYVRLIREIQPKGPYRLAGWCVSGWTAYGIARELEKLGERIDLLIMIDAWAPGYWSRETRVRRMLMQAIYRGQRFRWVCRRLKQASASTRNAYIGRSLHGMAAAAARNLTVLLHRWHLPVQVRLTEEMRRAEQLEFTASRAFHAGPLQGDILLFRSEEQPIGPMLAPDMGWGEVIGRPVGVQVLPGDHHEVFDLPGARMMAERVSEMLGTAPAPQATATKPDRGSISTQRSQSSSLVEVVCRTK